MRRNEPNPDGQTISIVSGADIAEARAAARTLATSAGFAGLDLVMIASAVSEVARNIVEHGGSGEVVLSVVHNRSRRGLRVVARDRGPGIADLSLAMQDGYSTSRGLGMGLPGSQRMMDEFAVESQAGLGTTITMGKWLS